MGYTGIVCLAISATVPSPFTRGGDAEARKLLQATHR